MINRFKAMSMPVRHMVFLYWIYEFSMIIVSSFLAAFVFLQTDSIFQLVIYQVVYFTGVFLGFCAWGYLVAQLQMSMRLNYLKAFALFFLSFLVLIIFPSTLPVLLVFAFFNGTALGMFWLGVHAYELILTKNAERDFYSSMLMAGGQTLKILSPLVATASVIIAEQYLKIETFRLLFWVIPCVYLLSIPSLFKLPDFTSEKIKKGEMRRLFTDSRIRKHRVYYFIQSLDWANWSVLYSVIALGALGSVINMGIFETIMGVIAVITILSLANFRHEGNRLKIMLFATLGSAAAYSLLFFWQVSPYFFMAYALALIILRPIFRVSEHTIDLQSIESLRETEHASFYGGLIYRDIVIYWGRMAALALLGVSFYLTQSTSFTIATGLALAIFTAIAVWFAARRVAKN